MLGHQGETYLPLFSLTNLSGYLGVRRWVSPPAVMSRSLLWREESDDTRQLALSHYADTQ